MGTRPGEPQLGRHPSTHPEKGVQQAVPHVLHHYHHGAPCTDRQAAQCECHHHPGSSDPAGVKNPGANPCTAWLLGEIRILSQPGCNEHWVQGIPVIPS